MSKKLKSLAAFCNPTHPDCPLQAENEAKDKEIEGLKEGYASIYKDYDRLVHLHEKAEVRIAELEAELEEKWKE